MDNSQITTAFWIVASGVIIAANVGNLAWSGPTLPPGAVLSEGTEINHNPSGNGGLHVIKIEAPATILLGSRADWWDKAIRLSPTTSGTHASYSRRFRHEGRKHRGAKFYQSIADWDLTRLMVCFYDLK